MLTRCATRCISPLPSRLLLPIVILIALALHIGITRTFCDAGTRAGTRTRQMRSPSLLQPRDPFSHTHATPECSPAPEILHRWGRTGIPPSGVRAYNQSRCRQDHLALRSMLHVLIGFLDRERIPWFFEGGALLGIRRHNNTLIPWDSDIDICVVVQRGWVPGRGYTATSSSDGGLYLANFAARLMTFAASSTPASSPASNPYTIRSCAFNNQGLCTTAFKVHRPGQRVVGGGLFVDGPHIDVQPVLSVPSDNGAQFRFLNAFWRNRIYPVSAVVPIMPCLLYDLVGRCPVNSHKVLTVLFGADYLSATSVKKMAIEGSGEEEEEEEARGEGEEYKYEDEDERSDGEHFAVRSKTELASLSLPYLPSMTSLPEEQKEVGSSEGGKGGEGGAAARMYRNRKYLPRRRHWSLNTLMKRRQRRQRQQRQQQHIEHRKRPLQNKRRRHHDVPSMEAYMAQLGGKQEMLSRFLPKAT